MLREDKLGLLEICDKIILSLYDKGDKKMKDKIINFMNLYALSS